jgi:hypothetical protein
LLVIPALVRLRQKDRRKSVASLGHIARLKAKEKKEGRRRKGKGGEDDVAIGRLCQNCDSEHMT